MQKSIIYLLLSSVFTLILFANSDSYYEKIKIRSRLIVAMSDEFPPLKFKSKGKDIGIEMEVAKGLADFLKVKLEYRTSSLAERITLLESGQVDMVIASLSTDLNRAQKIWFSIPYLEITAAALVIKGSLPQTKFGEDFEERPITTIWQLKHLSDFTFIVKKDTVHESMLKTEFQGKRVITVASDKEGLALLTDRKGDGYVQDSVYLEYQFSHNIRLQSGFRLLKGGYKKDTIAIGLPFGASTLKNQVDFWISDAKRKRLFSKWLRQYTQKE